MRSIAFKLTLAFLAIGLISVVLVALIVGGRASRAFDSFVASREQVDIAERATQYYALNGSWEGLRVDESQTAPGRFARMRQPVWLLDTDDTVVFGPPSYRGPERDLSTMPSIPLEVEGEVVGTLIFEENPAIAGLREPLEQAYVSAINRSILLSALLATALALLLGALLAYTITRPLREMTEATRAVAGGKLGLQVPVRSHDELGDLATSFNVMSHDLARSSQIRQQMTADIAHDLRTPLSVILGYTEALNDGKLRGSPDMFRAMHQQSLHLSRLIEDLRTLSLADAGQLSLQMENMPPCVLLSQTALAYSAHAEGQSITLEVKCPPECPSVLIDADRMMQVLSNLVTNAIRHTQAGGTITLSADCGGDQVQLSVSDTGSGISPDDLPYIFDRFYRADKARQADGATGLGLAIARSLVIAQGGAITANSNEPQGTEFVISLPIASMTRGSEQ